MVSRAKVLCLSVALGGASLAALPTAQAAPVVAADPAPTSVTFSTAGQHAWTVPAGVTRVDVVAVGGEGGSTAARGGRGAKVEGTLDVTPGQTLYAVVGGRASGATPGANGGGLPGGLPCTGARAAGGGASDVRTVPLGEPGSAESRILVAGGGGGAGTGPEDFRHGSQHDVGGDPGSLGGWAGRDGTGGAGGADGLGGAGNATTGGQGRSGVEGETHGCGGGGGGGWGGGGGGAWTSTSASGGGGGGGSLVPGGYVAGNAERGEAPSITFRTPGLPAQAGPLRLSAFQTFKQNDQGGGVIDFTNCPFSCNWIDGSPDPTAPGAATTRDPLYATSQSWGQAGVINSEYGQAFLAGDPLPNDTAAALGKPFRLTDLAHYNIPLRGDSPTELGLQTRLTVRPEAGPDVVFSLLGPSSLRIHFVETDNGSTCDPELQESTTPCDDVWSTDDRTVTTTVAGVTWKLHILGWRKGSGPFRYRVTSEEQLVTQWGLYAQLDVDTKPTSTTVEVDGGTPGSPVLTSTTAPVPQTGGTVSFTDGGASITGCTDVPVDTATGKATCSPGPVTGSHSYGAGFSGSLGYGASTATPVPYTYDDTQTQTVTFVAPSGVTYGDAGVALGATASSGLPVTYSSATPAVCTIESGVLHARAAGTCTVTASQAGNEDYEAASQERSFEIGKAALTVTADAKTRAVGEANPTLTATTTGFVNGDDATVIAGTPSLSTTADAASPAGTYPITVSTASMSAANYTFTGVTGTLTVTPVTPPDPLAACSPGAPVPSGYKLINGTASSDLLYGTAGKDLIRAGNGDDLIVSGAGADIVCAGNGNDVVQAGGGDDLISGGAGIDVLGGGAGTDRAVDTDLWTFLFGVEIVG